MRQAVPAAARAPGAGFPLAGLGGDLLVGLAAVAALSVQVWADSAYTGDDANTLYPVAEHSVVATLHYYIRPIEYVVVQLANQAWLPAWLVASALCAVLAACLQVRNAEMVIGQRFSPLMRRALVVGSPLWFYAISQVDTVSQTLCNLAFAAALHALLRALGAPPRDVGADSPDASAQAARWLAAVNVLSAVLLFTKELAITASLVLPALGAWAAWRMRLRRDVRYLATAALFALALAAWVILKLHFKSMMPEESGHYNLTPGPLDIARNTLATLAFGLTPLPTSLLSLAGWAKVWTVCGVAAAAMLLWAARKMRWRELPTRALACALIVTCIPMFYVHSSELYVSMLGTLFAALVVALLGLRPPIALAWCAAMLLCSYINGWVYFHAGTLHDHGIERTPYSVYWGPNGLGQDKAPGALDCPLGRTESVSWDCGNLVCHLSGGQTLRVAVPHAARCG